MELGIHLNNGLTLRSHSATSSWLAWRTILFLSAPLRSWMYSLKSYSLPSGFRKWKCCKPALSMPETSCVSCFRLVGGEMTMSFISMIKFHALVIHAGDMLEQSSEQLPDTMHSISFTEGVLNTEGRENRRRSPQGEPWLGSRALPPRSASSQWPMIEAREVLRGAEAREWSLIYSV